MSTMKRFLIPLLPLACASAHAATLTVTSLADDGSAGTLRAVVAAAQDGDVVTFAASLAGGTMTIVKTAHADTGIPVSASISIIGPADRSISLDGGFHGSNTSADIGSTILQVAGADVSLVCENLVFQHANGRDWGSAITYGGAVCCEGDATFRNCVFASNQVASVKISGRRSIYGGAIDVGGDLVVENCRFVGNTGPNNPVRGASICHRGERVSVRNTSFEDERTGSYCGAIYLSSSGKDAVVENCTFSGIRAGNKDCIGSAILSEMDGGSVLRIEGCAFRDCGFNNTAARGGAVGQRNASELQIVGCEFSGNAGSSCGGAIRVEKGTTVLVNSTFAGNAANCHGGAVDLRGTSWLVNCTIVGNFLVHVSDHSASAAIYRGSASLSLLNTVAVHNYYNKNETDGMTQGNIVNSINAATLSSRASLGDGSAADDETALFASYGTSASATIHYGSGGTIAFASPLPVPLLNDDARKTRVVEIAERGPLDRTGYPVRHSADWSAIAYTTDGGSTWTALRGNAEDATIPILQDQRGADYPVSAATGLPKTCIGAAAVKRPVGTLLLVK